MITSNLMVFHFLSLLFFFCLQFLQSFCPSLPPRSQTSVSLHRGGTLLRRRLPPVSAPLHLHRDRPPSLWYVNYRDNLYWIIYQAFIMCTWINVASNVEDRSLSSNLVLQLLHTRQNSPYYVSFKYTYCTLCKILYHVVYWYNYYY